MINKNLLPSKQMTYILGACLIVVILIIFALHGSLPTFAKKTTQNATDTNAQLIAVAQQIENIDSDHDGLKDWEEVLWKTDPHNPDTDGDGMSDGEEVLKGRDPGVAGAGNLQNGTGAPKANVTASSASVGTTSTDQFARDAFSQYVTYKRAGINMSSDVQNSMANQLLNQSDKKPKDYTLTSINTAPVSNQEALTTYGNNIGATIKNNSSGLNYNEVMVVGDALQNQNTDGLVRLDAIIKSYQTTIQAYLKLQVPNSIAAKHLELINSMQAVSYDIQGFKQVVSDPVVGVLAIRDYQTDITRMSNAFISISNALTSAGITYQKGQGGYLITETASQSPKN